MAKMPGVVSAPARLAKQAPLGQVTVIAAVTGTVDKVDDLIQPGAFARTLRVMRPKVVRDHQWTDKAGRVVRIEELLPGNPRLPKQTQDGRPWPAEAGALIATLQFNLRVQAGRDAYEWARFYHETREGAWSIGYKVVVGKALRRRDGVRVILDLDLFEISDVLHGAHGDTATLEVKTGAPTDLERKQAPGFAAVPARPRGLASLAVMEAKALNTAAGKTSSKVKYAGLAVVAEDTGRALLLQRTLTPNDPAGGTWEFPGGGLENDETPAAGALREWKEETGLHLPAGELTGTWDSPNGVYRGHAYAIKREQDVLLNPGADDRVVLNPDDPACACPEVTAWFALTDLPSMPALRPEMQGTDWQLLGRAAGGLAERALEGKNLHCGTAGTVTLPALGRAQRTSPKPTRSRSRGLAAAAVKSARAFPPASRLETKTMPHTLTGSYEQRHEQLRAAVHDLFGRDTDDGCCLVCIEATYDDHLIVTVEMPGEPPASHEVPYTFDPDGQVSLGKPEPTDIVVMAVPSPDSPDAGPTEVVDEQAAVARFYAPAAAMLTDATSLISLGAEGKQLDEHLRPALLRLLDTLAGKGIDPYADDLTAHGALTPEVDPDSDALVAAKDAAAPTAPVGEHPDAEDDDEDADADDDEPVLAPVDDEHLPTPDPDNDTDGDQATAETDQVTLTPEQVRAELDELAA